MGRMQESRCSPLEEIWHLYWDRYRNTCFFKYLFVPPNFFFIPFVYLLTKPQMTLTFFFIVLKNASGEQEKSQTVGSQGSEGT